MNKKLGIIFPEQYYKSLIKFGEGVSDSDFKYVNYFLNKIYHKVKVKKGLISFAEGNMFWAKINAIYQVFELFSIVILKSKILKNCFISKRINSYK